MQDVQYEAHYVRRIQQEIHDWEVFSPICYVNRSHPLQTE
jgi:hypothetical protein